jgi:hypothetical protein
MNGKRKTTNERNTTKPTRSRPILWPALLTLLESVQLTSAFYDPTVQRWINRDPIGERGGANLHAFVHNQPVSNWDRDGREAGFEYPRPGMMVPPPCKPVMTPEVCYQRALAADREYFPGNADPYEGGFRHCVAACCLRRNFGYLAGLIVWLWDTWNDEVEGDRAGEQEGLLAAGRAGSCEEECLRSYPSPQPGVPVRR